MFQLIALEESRAESLTVKYDPELGYPTEISVDINEQTADDEYTLTISDLVDEGGVACTATVEDGLLLSVTDQTTQMPIACGVTATAMEEAYSETVMVDDTDCVDDDLIAMLEERPGFYSLTVQKQGYQDYQVDNVGIGKDLCHVLTREFNVELIPE
jgi:inosine/xanthosine triphosphate pyrophosphatase family protein